MMESQDMSEPEADTGRLEQARVALGDNLTRNHAGVYLEALLACESEELIDDDRFRNGVADVVEALLKPDQFQAFVERVAALSSPKDSKFAAHRLAQLITEARALIP